jgi:hypothetical protein
LIWVSLLLAGLWLAAGLLLAVLLLARLALAVGVVGLNLLV